MKISKIVCLFCMMSISLIGCSQEESFKINGVSLVASVDTIRTENILPLKELSANYSAVIPFGFIKNLNHPEVLYNSKRQWYGETIEGARQYIKKLRLNQIEIMLKPQIWIWRGEYTGHLQMQSEKDWEVLEQTYRSFILDYAQLAEDEKVSLFCIGTELELFVKHRSDYWQKLIGEVRKVYNGKLTYAANWDEYKRVPFWKQLDYIGIDAYFPISDLKTPKLNKTEEKWKEWGKELEQLAQTKRKKVLFTEYGYRSVDYAGKEPWSSHRIEGQLNMQAQEVAYQALFNTVWQEGWFAGGFLWKWFIDYPNSGGLEDNRFTPQNKPVEKVIRSNYQMN